VSPVTTPYIICTGGHFCRGHTTPYNGRIIEVLPVIPPKTAANSFSPKSWISSSELVDSKS
jgi:hypothetical protein